MSHINLRAFVAIVFIYFSVMMLIQFKASAHDMVCPPCNCAESTMKAPAGGGGAHANSGQATTPPPAPAPGWVQAMQNNQQAAAAATPQGGAGGSIPSGTNVALNAAGKATGQAAQVGSSKDAMTSMVVVSSKQVQNKNFKKIFATISTTMGSFKILLFHTLAPKTVENFVGLAEGTKESRDRTTNELVKKQFYNGLKIFRVRKDFFIQTGDPANDGSGGPGYTFNDEFQPQLTHSKPGIVSMVTGGPNQNGSQFFISLVPRPDLDKRYTVFGEVVEGLEVVQNMSRVPINRGIEKPLQDIIIQSISISRE